MWLTSHLNRGDNSPYASRGSITGANGKRVQVDASAQHRDLKLVAPYGIYYVPPIGEGAVVLPFDGGEACVGVVAVPSHKLERGELMLYSQGGASIVLKNDGTVLINGKQVG